MKVLVRSVFIILSVLTGYLVAMLWYNFSPPNQPWPILEQEGVRAIVKKFFDELDEKIEWFI